MQCSVNGVKLLHYWCNVYKAFLSHIDENVFQQLLLIIKTGILFSTFFIFKAIIYTTEFLEPPSDCPITCGSLSLHALLILVENFEAFCPSLNSHNIKRRRPFFHIFIIEGFVCFKTIVILKRNYKLLLSIYYLVYKPKIGLLIQWENDFLQHIWSGQ